MALKGKKQSSSEKKAQKKYNAKPSSKKDRAARGRARYAAEKEGRVKKGQDLDHKKKLKQGGSNAKSNTKARSVSANRKDNGRSKK